MSTSATIAEGSWRKPSESLSQQVRGKHYSYSKESDISECRRTEKRPRTKIKGKKEEAGRKTGEGGGREQRVIGQKWVGGSLIAMLQVR